MFIGEIKKEDKRCILSFVYQVAALFSATDFAFLVDVRVTTFLGNLEMTGNLTGVRDMSGNWPKVRELSGKITMTYNV